MNRKELIHCPVADLEFTAIDLETTGVVPVRDEIIEIGASRFDSRGKKISEFVSFIDPKRTIPQNVINIHGITNSMVDGAPVIGKILPDFLDFIENSVLIAHNASFDSTFLAVALGKAGYELSDHPILDTLKISKKIFPDSPNFKLSTLVDYLKLSKLKSHRALNDAINTGELFAEVLNKTKRKEVETLVSLSEIWNLPILSFKNFNIFPAKIPEGFEVIKEAIEMAHSVLIEYVGGTKGKALRKITPLSYYAKKDKMYIQAICDIDKIEKCFRFDKIDKILSV